MHTACHGQFDTENPNGSALVLAGSTKSVKSDQTAKRSFTLRSGETVDLEKCLTLADIFSLDLRQTSLVVLSACETGISRVNITDDYIGLPSGFLYAGVGAVVCSLWKVNDFSSSLLMIRFHENMKEGATVAYSLKAAQEYIRNAPRENILIEYALAEIKKHINYFNEDFSSFDDQKKEYASFVIKQLEDILRGDILAKIEKQNDYYNDNFLNLDEREKKYASFVFKLLPNIESNIEKPFANPRYWAAFICVGNESI